MYTFVKSTHHRGLTTRGDAFFIVAPALTTNPLVRGFKTKNLKFFQKIFDKNLHNST